MLHGGLDLLERLEEDPFAPWRGREGAPPAVGTICPCVPAELIHGAGFAPVLVPPRVSSAPLADAHLPAACCALARGALEVALRGDLGFLQGMVLHRTCDAMTFLGDLWPHAVGRGFADVL
ncbi:MAG: 2-hydroxyacyl-CoA dehydratase, partial [Anaerolineae bacterium]